MILDGADHAWMVRPVANGRLEDYTLIVALALSLGFDAVGTGRTLFTAFDPTFATSQATSLGPLAHLGSSRQA